MKDSIPPLEALRSPANPTFHLGLGRKIAEGEGGSEGEKSNHPARCTNPACKGTLLRILALSLPAEDEFFLLPLLTGGIIDLSATSLEMLSLMPLCLQSPMVPPPSLPEASTADQSTCGSNEKHYIIVKKEKAL